MMEEEMFTAPEMHNILIALFTQVVEELPERDIELEHRFEEVTGHKHNDPIGILFKGFTLGVGKAVQVADKLRKSL